MDKNGYAVRTVWLGADSYQVYLHRVLLGLERGDPREGDHISRDPLDCRRENLRIVTHAQNGQNRDSNRSSSSRYRGVSRNRGRGRAWKVGVKVNGQRHHLGYFDDEDEAGAAAAAFRAEHMPYSEEARAQ